MRISLVSTTVTPETLKAAKPLVREFFTLAEVAVLSGNMTWTTGVTGTGTDRGRHDDGEADALITVEFNTTYFNFEAVTKIVDTVLDPNEGSDSSEPVITACWIDVNRFGKSEIHLTFAQVQAVMEQPAVGREAPETLLVKRAVIALLSQVTGRELPWGVLTGIRPSKLIHYWADRGVHAGRRVEALCRRYGLRREKAQLLEQIVAVQQPYLQAMQAYPHQVAVYASIPFCPSRCSYCSFPGQVPQRDRGDVRNYLVALRSEAAAVGEMMGRLGLRADALYLGGGTPTILGTGEIEELLADLALKIPRTATAELTVEAGRPDTLDAEKLAALRACGVTRLSVNPQSMHESTLQRVGRIHTLAEVERAYHEAAALSGWVINMDLIIGLPGEGVAEVTESAARIGLLRPANLTVHALALKRGSREWEQGYRHVDGSSLAQMQMILGEAAHSWGLRPYYLYRQKQMAGNAENIGYALPGRECRYNIAIMEERQSVIGMGAGSSTKVVNPGDFSLRNLQHQTDWRTYVDRWRQNHAKRVAEFGRIFPG